MTKVESRVELVLADLLRDLGSDESRRAYRESWSYYITWLEVHGIAVLDARPPNVKAYITHLRDQSKARSTSGRALSIIRRIYGALVVDELLKINPAREVKNPKQDRDLKTPVLDEEQVRQLFALECTNWRERRDRACLAALFGLGWRRSEVARMQVEDFDRGSVTGIFKGKKQVTVGVPPWVQKELDDWLKYAGICSGAIFPFGQGYPGAMTGKMVYDAVDRMRVKLGWKKGSLTPHAMRRTNITLEGERGVDIKKRQLAVGHSRSSTTERYDLARNAAKNAPGEVLEDLVYGKKSDKENGE